MPWIDVGTIAWIAIAALLLAGALAPLETLGWWAGWYGDPVDEAETEPALGADDESIAVAGAEPDAGPVDPWVVYLSGINAADATSQRGSETLLLARLRASLPSGRVVEVFPYSVTNRALTGERVFAGVWRWAQRAKLSRRRLLVMAGFIINLRNVWQVLVSADRRYGPFYNRGSAELIVRALRRQGFGAEASEEQPHIVLIGYSGGAQVALGAAPFVKEGTGGRVTVVALGGVMCADPGVLDAETTWHLFGGRDRVHRWSAWGFPGRWPLLAWSPWNVARRRGTIRSVQVSPCDHTGKNGYLDNEAFVADGRSYLEVTADVLAAIAAGRGEPLPVAA